MNTNTGWGAFTNQKKENQDLKKQLIVQDANRNGIRLIIDEKDNFKNVISEETQFRFSEINKKEVKNEVLEDDDDDIILETTLQDIENEIANLQKQLVISKEIKRQKELLKAEQNKKIAAVKAEINDKTEKFNLEMLELNKKLIALQENKNIVPIQQIIDRIEEPTKEKEKEKEEEQNAEQKENKIEKPTIEAKKRRPLHEVIKRPTKFKTVIKGIEFLSFTEDGHKIIGNSQSFGTLNKWLEYAISTICKVNTTKKSVYEVVYYYNIEKKEWRLLKTDYTIDTTRLN
jgi:hypothetical protein